MAFLITAKQKLFSSNGAELPSELFCRFTFEPAWVGASIYFRFRMYLSKAIENQFSETDIVWFEDVDSIDELGDPIVVTSKRVFPKQTTIDISPQYALENEAIVDAYFDSFKVTPFGQYLISVYGESFVYSQVTFHIMAKGKLEEYFGIDSAVIRLDLA